MLGASAAAVGAYAAVLVVRPDVAVRLFDVLGFGPGAASIPPGPATEHVMFTYRVLGAVLLGWMVLVGGLAAGAARGRHDAQLAVLVSLGAWFLADTGVSLLVEETEHAFFNVAFLVVLGLPAAVWWAGRPGRGPSRPPLVAGPPERTSAHGRHRPR